MKKVFFAITLFILSCSSNDNIEYTPLDFSNSVDIKAELVGKQLPYDVGELLIIDNYFVIGSLMDDKYNHIYDTEGKKIISVTGYGRGPFEMSQVDNISTIPNSNLFSVYDAHSKTLLTYNVDSLIRGNVDCFDSRHIEKIEGFRLVRNLFAISKNRYIYMNKVSALFDVPYERFVMVNEKEEVLDYYSNIPKGDDRFTMEYIVENGRVSISPQGDYMVTTSFVSAILEIFDFEDKINLRTIKYFDEPIFKHDNLNMTDYTYTKTGFVDVYAANDLIYTIYSDSLVTNFEKPNKIVIFNRNGDVKQIYNTNMDNARIVYNENDNCIYTLVRDKIYGYQFARYILN